MYMNSRVVSYKGLSILLRACLLGQASDSDD